VAEAEAIVVHEDALDAACQAASRSIDQLIWQGSAEVAKAVTLFGPGIVVLPLFGKVSGVEDTKCLVYSAHPKRAARGGLMDRVDFESKFGQLDPGRLVEELAGGRAGLDRRLKVLSNEELHDEVVSLQDWREKANGRLKTLEKRAAWAFLGMPAGSASQSAIKRAFKKKALELHPDKGGDAERFQLLQEMKELLIIPTPKELEEQEREARERDKETEKARENEKERERKRTEHEADEDDETEGADFSSDSSYDVDEEFKKMFPKKKKKKKRDTEEDHPDGDLDLKQGDDFNRDKHEAARRKLHRNFVEMWERANKLAEEIKRTQSSESGDALRQLRKFADRFANLEVSKLKENDPKKAERIFRRFLEQGSEVLCAAGAVDPVATVSCVAMQLNYPLMSLAPSDDLQQRCSALLEAIKSLPAIFGRYLTPAEDAVSSRRRAAKEATAAAEEVQFFFRLLVPDPGSSSKRPDGMELPGISEVDVELPPGSTLADLRNAAIQMCGNCAPCKIAPRLFCAGRFLAGAGNLPLADVAVLKEGKPIQCLPSNQLLRPPPSAVVEAAAAVPAAVSKAQTASSAATESSTAARPADPAAEASGARGAAAQPSLGVSSNSGAAGGGAASAATHKPSRELLSALGLAGPRPSTTGVPEAGKGMEATRQAAQDAADGGAEAEAHQRPVDEQLAAERRAKEEVERKAAAEDEGEEDPWFDSFFADTKRAADTQVQREREEQEARIAAERKLQQEAQDLEHQKREEERAQRKAAQEQGKNAMEARVRAQKQAAEAKRKLEKEKRKALETRKKVAEQQKADSNLEGMKADETNKQAGNTLRPQQEGVKTDAIVAAKEDFIERSIQRRHVGWDENWEHPCAGDRKPDGSAVFCYPCDGWINVGDPFDHRGFELHCEKVGHYGWID